MMLRWRRRVRDVGDAFLGVVQAELQAMVAEIQDSGKGLAKALALLLAALAVAFWALGVFIAFAVALLATWLGVWKATAIVFLVLALVGGLLAAFAWRILRRLRSPTTIVRTRVTNHLGWWRETLDVPDGDDARER